MNQVLQARAVILRASEALEELEQDVEAKALRDLLELPLLKLQEKPKYDEFVRKLYRRRESTPWSEKELKALKKIPETTEDELEMLERYTKECEFARRDPFTLMGNWASEVDRARIWCSKNLLKNQDSEPPNWRRMLREETGRDYSSVLWNEVPFSEKKMIA